MATAQEMLDQYTAAELAALDGQSVTINGNTYTSQNLSEIRKGREYWQSQVNLMKRGGRRYSLVRFS
jgi:hypothetical protein